MINKVIDSIHNKPILLDCFKGDVNKPLVIFSHGFKGFKDWGHFNYLANEFKAKGLNFVKFNFSHNGGTIEQPIDFPDLEAFGNNNFCIELDDLGCVIDWCFENMEFSELMLMGHSRGGGITILKAAEDDRVNKIVTWAAVSNFDKRFPEEEIKQWRKDGVTYIENARTKQQMPLYFQLYENTLENADRVNIEKAAKSLAISHLIIHGTEDDVVKINEANDLNDWSKKSDLITIQDGDHSFGASHPFNEEEDELHIHVQEVIRDSIEYFLS